MINMNVKKDNMHMNMKKKKDGIYVRKRVVQKVIILKTKCVFDNVHISLVLIRKIALIGVTLRILKLYRALLMKK